MMRSEMLSAVSGCPTSSPLFAVHAGMKSELSAAALLGESTPLSPERIRELYVDAADFNRTWDGRSTIWSSSGWCFQNPSRM